jgi:hypothetical protein
MKTLPAILIRGGKVVNVGDTLLTTRGKTFYVTGWDEFSGTVHGTSTCEQHYFISAPAKVFGCNFSTEEIRNGQSVSR